MLIAAALWPLYRVNLGTLLRTCDAVGACLAVPRLPWVHDALARGNTLRRLPCVHWIREAPQAWLREQRTPANLLVGAELTPDSVRLVDLRPATGRTILVLGHEQTGIPPDALDLFDLTVQIPMIGSGHSLNVAVAGSLLLYKLAGFA
jgi:tRNA (guanosine-2'-O-)-methyltransferase